VNRLYFGDNLEWLRDRREFPDASVDLVYLDPPFNSNADYNVLFRELSGAVSQAQFHAFTDTWSWADAAETYHAFIDNCPNVAVVELMEALHSFLKHSPMMAYLAMMAPPRRTPSRPQTNRQPLSALRSDGESLPEAGSRLCFRRTQFRKRNFLEEKRSSFFHQPHFQTRPRYFVVICALGYIPIRATRGREFFLGKSDSVPRLKLGSNRKTRQFAPKMSS
jgi:hypothetical protein